MHALALPAFFVVIVWHFLTGYALAGETCINRDGVEVCVQAKGPCDLSRLIPREVEGLNMEMLLLTVSNESDKRVRLDPASFFGITEAGQAMQLDMPLFHSIEIRTKLRKVDLAPGGQATGYLFFPAWEGHLRTVVHKGQPAFQLRLY
jgi:hypothetical protein